MAVHVQCYFQLCGPWTYISHSLFYMHTHTYMPYCGLLEWSVRKTLSIIMLLPVDDVAQKDRVECLSMYNAISSCAVLGLAFLTLFFYIHPHTYMPYCGLLDGSVRKTLPIIMLLPVNNVAQKDRVECLSMYNAISSCVSMKDFGENTFSFFLQILHFISSYFPL